MYFYIVKWFKTLMLNIIEEVNVVIYISLVAPILRVLKYVL